MVEVVLVQYSRLGLIALGLRSLKGAWYVKGLLVGILLPVLLIFLSYSIAVGLDGVHGRWGLDTYFHFLAGMFVALGACILLRRIYYSVDCPEIFHGVESFFLILGVVALFGVGWEFFEYFLPPPFAPFEAMDTFKDLIFDLAGGASGAFFYSVRYKSQDVVSEP
jgi:hypothetical protein